MSETVFATGVLLSEIEDMIKRVHGVIAAKVVANESGEIEEIHVVSDSTRGAKQVARDIESVLIAQFDLRVDHKKISIAQIGSGQAYCTGDVAIEIDNIQVVHARTNTTVTVRLCMDREMYEGTASAPIVSANSIKLCALATISAIQQMLNAEHTVELEDLARICLNSCPIVVVLVLWISKRCQETLVGAALINKSDVEAVVNAIVSAVNRRLSSRA